MHLFMNLLRTNPIVNDFQSLRDYENREVRDFIDDVIQPVAQVRIMEAEQAIYLVPEMDNAILSYSNTELREAMKLKHNGELYLFHFSVAVLLGSFYNSDTMMETTRQYLSLAQLHEEIEKHIVTMENLKPEEKDEYFVDFDVDADAIVRSWRNRSQNVEQITELDGRKKGNQYGLLYSFMDFLAKENYVSILRKQEIRLTSKTEKMFEGYYRTNERKSAIFDLLNYHRHRWEKEDVK